MRLWFIIFHNMAEIYCLDEILFKVRYNKLIHLFIHSLYMNIFSKSFVSQQIWHLLRVIHYVSLLKELQRKSRSLLACSKWKRRRSCFYLRRYFSEQRDYYLSKRRVTMISGARWSKSFSRTNVVARPDRALIAMKVNFWRSGRSTNLSYRSFRPPWRFPSTAGLESEAKVSRRLSGALSFSRFQLTSQSIGENRRLGFFYPPIKGTDVTKYSRRVGTEWLCIGRRLDCDVEN